MSTPKIKGDVVFKPLKEPVQIVRSRFGIPLIEARNAYDAYFALGVVHAQDRLFQMEMLRRLANGRTAEIIGKAGLPADKLMRTLGIAELAKKDFENMEIKDALKAYSDGINSYILSNNSFFPPELPIEFALLQLKPEPWKPEDSLAIGRLLGLFLSNNVRDELMRANLAKTLSPDQLSDLYPTYPDNAPVSLPSYNPVDLKIIEKAQEILGPVLPEPGASNAWALSGKHTISQSPILAGDPHLPLSLPGFWTLARIEFPDQVLSGGFMPGIPYVLIGHNESIAWSMTTSYADVQDLILVHTPLITETVTQTITVRGDEPVSITIEKTPEGVILNPLIQPEDFTVPPGSYLVLKSSALALENRTPSALQAMNWADKTGDFLSALQDFSIPSQNVIFATTAGDIGLYMTGRIPLRKSSKDGFMPESSVNARLGMNPFRYIPSEQLPFILNPLDGVIINANNRTVDTSFTYPFNTDFQPPYRAKRIAQLLNQPKKWSLQDMSTLQMDNISLMALDLLPVLLPMINVQKLDDTGKEVFTILKQWQGEMDKDAPSPLIFTHFLDTLEQDLLKGKVPDDYSQDRRILNPFFIKNALKRQDFWCDDKDIPGTQTCSEIITKSFSKATEKLKNTYGFDPNGWRWGDQHPVRFENPLYSQIPFIGEMLNISEPMDGGQETINRATFFLRPDETRYAARHGAGLRVVFDLANLDNSLFMIAPGQSGQLLSGYERNLVDRWIIGDMFRLNKDTGDFKELSMGTLDLLP